MSRHDLQGAIRVHPGPSAYNKGCRCKDCTALNRRRGIATRLSLAARPQEDVPHGPSGYQNWGCRCEVCRAAGSRGNAVKRARGKLAAGKPLTAREAEALASVGEAVTASG